MLFLLLTMELALGVIVPAAAQKYELESGKNGYFVCEDFDDEMPHIAKGIFSYREMN